MNQADIDNELSEFAKTFGNIFDYIMSRKKDYGFTANEIASLLQTEAGLSSATIKVVYKKLVDALANGRKSVMKSVNKAIIYGLVPIIVGCGGFFMDRWLYSEFNYSNPSIGSQLLSIIFILVGLSIIVVSFVELDKLDDLIKDFSEEFEVLDKS